MGWDSAALFDLTGGERFNWNLTPISLPPRQKGPGGLPMALRLSDGLGDTVRPPLFRQFDGNTDAAD